ncbi:hypothetical protein [Streptomyces canus]|uniref:hypothetical protein n=1 Tax=Streptomyces canus TaxID=58343 RepID=UPI003712374F
MTVVCTGLRAGIEEVFPPLEANGSRVVLLWGAPVGAEGLDAARVADNLAGVVSAGAGEDVASVARSSQSVEEAVSRRLGALQR